MSRFSLLQDRDGGEKRKKKGGCLRSTLFVPNMQVISFQEPNGSEVVN